DEFSRRDEYPAATICRSGVDGGVGNCCCRFLSNCSVSLVVRCDCIRAAGNSALFLAELNIDISAGWVRALFAAQFSDRRDTRRAVDIRPDVARQDVRRSLFDRYPEDGVSIRKGGGNPILQAAQKSRAWMQTAICRGLDDSPQAQNFLSGLALGLRHQSPEDIEEPFQQTGTLHLFAVAGLHVGIVARLLW